jgi:hypothetical protein
MREMQNKCSINDQPEETKFYYEFMKMNKELFEKLGFKDISSDPIFNLEVEVDPKKGVNNCEICKKEISRFFSKNKSCKFCGYILCDKCSTLKRKIPKSNSEKTSIICTNCDNKFINYELHNNFKENLTQKEFEIKELNQKLEKLSLIYSDQLDTINKLNESIMKRKRENETKEDILTTEIKLLKNRTEEICVQSEKSTLKINESQNILKVLEEKKKLKDQEYNDIQKDREEITFEFERRQSYMNEVLTKINGLSISIKNHQQQNIEKEKELKKETGNKHLDMLLKEKIQKQRSSISNSSSMNETTIIINPSKILKEVYTEPLLKKDVKKEGNFKKFIMYLGSKILIKD